MDPLSDIVGLLRPRAVLFKPITGRGRWGVRYAPYGRPGFALVLEGACWLAVEGAAPVRLARGDFLLLPSTPAFTMASDSDADCRPAEPSSEAVRHGDPAGEPDFRMLGGAFAMESPDAALLVGLLPRVIHVRAADAGTDRLGRLVALLADECDADRPGRDMIVARLLEVMLAECLRWDGGSSAAAGSGLLAGLRDPALARALRALHGDVRAGWTVADLARQAGMSRTAFAVRFSDTLGCAPMEYLARWRMSLARAALAAGTASLERLAHEIGYESASAFSTAFRRRIGCSPGAYARACRTAA